MNNIIKAIVVITVGTCITSVRAIFKIKNQAGHDLYVVIASPKSNCAKETITWQGKSIAGVAQGTGKKMAIQAGLTSVVTISLQPTDRVTVHAFYTDSDGMCHGNTLTMDFKTFAERFGADSEGFVIREGVCSGSDALVEAALCLQKMDSSENACNRWYKEYIRRKKDVMPAHKP